LPPEHWAFNAEVGGAYPYDPDRARLLLEEAGWVDQDQDGVREAAQTLSGDYSCGRGMWTIPQGTPFEVTFHTTLGTSYRETIAVLFAEDMAELGIKLNVEMLTGPEWFGPEGPLVQRTFQIGEFAWVAEEILPSAWFAYGGQNIYNTPQDGPLAAETILAQTPALVTDAESFLFGRPSQLPAGYALAQGDSIPSAADSLTGGNFGGWCNTAATQAAFEADQALTREERLPFDHEFQRQFVQDVPVLPLFQRLQVEVYSPWLCGVGRGPNQVASWNVETWEFDVDGSCD
jgi:ABC-type transport system substrate-binding protein